MAAVVMKRVSESRRAATGDWLPCALAEYQTVRNIRTMVDAFCAVGIAGYVRQLKVKHFARYAGG